jgi:hypothetical protein
MDGGEPCFHVDIGAVQSPDFNVLHVLAVFGRKLLAVILLQMPEIVQAA